MFKNVLVGVDGHLGGRDALALAKQLVAVDGQLTLAHVYPGDPRLRREPTLDYQQMEQERALKLLIGARDEGGVGAELRYEEASSPARGLHRLAEAMDADLLVVGVSRHGPLGRLLLGDDACGALNGAPSAVAMAPAGYAARAVAIHEVGAADKGSVELAADAVRS
jgi:nucleotide-binding universal stress UspA family protein